MIVKSPCLSICAAVLLCVACGQGSAPESASAAGPSLADSRPADSRPLQRIARREGPAADKARSGETPLFEPVAIPGFTDFAENHGGVATADLDRDGYSDLFVAYDTGENRMFLNDGRGGFERHAFRIVDSRFSAEETVGDAAIPIFADFDRDGFLDLYITRNEPLPIRPFRNPDAPSMGNSLWITQGAFDVFKEVNPAIGAANDGAYNRGAEIIDVNGDGWLDIANAADQIGHPSMGGQPVQRLYIYEPARSGAFEDGRFRDIAGTDRIPGYGGAFHCDPDIDMSGPMVLVRDFDGDQRPDVIKSYNVDMFLSEPIIPCSSTRHRFGVRAWRNQTRTPENPLFEPTADEENNTFGGVGRVRIVVPGVVNRVVSRGLSLAYSFAFDGDNDGDLDVLFMGASWPEFIVGSEDIAGSYFRNDGDWQFTDATEAVGLTPLRWHYTQWEQFWDSPLPDLREEVRGQFFRAVCAVFSPWRAKCLGLRYDEHSPYHSSLLAEDLNNDGHLDLLLTNRHEDDNHKTMRNVLFVGQGDGSFELVDADVSGLDDISISAEAIDMNGDGLIDVVMGRQPGNTNPLVGPDRAPQRFFGLAYLNTGALGGVGNHWAQIELVGRPMGELLGAQTFLRDAQSGERLGRRDLVATDAYKSSKDILVHWGLGQRGAARIEVLLPDGSRREFPVCVDRRARYDVTTGTVTDARSGMICDGRGNST